VSPAYRIGFESHGSVDVSSFRTALDFVVDVASIHNDRESPERLALFGALERLLERSAYDPFVSIEDQSDERLLDQTDARF
jgi:hypothetical protein